MQGKGRGAFVCAVTQVGVHWGQGRGGVCGLHQRQPGHGMLVPVLCVCRFLQLELSEMEAFVSQHKSKVIKRQVYIPFFFLLPYQGVYIFKIVCVYMQTGACHVCVHGCGGQRMTSGVILRNAVHLL